MVERRWLGVVRHAWCKGAPVVAGEAFVLYLRVTSHEWPDPHFVFYFQTMVVKSGYFLRGDDRGRARGCFSGLLYLTGLIVAALGPFPRDDRLAAADDPAAVAEPGIGMFSYYMGRSAESNLIAVCPPGILLLGLMGSEARVRVGAAVCRRPCGGFSCHG